MSFTPSTYQQKIFDFIKNENGNLLINAKAGSGKTTSIIESLKYIDTENLDVLFLAFNKSIKKEIDNRVKKNGLNVTVNTCHGYGYSLIMNHFDHTVGLDNNKYRNLLNDLINCSKLDDTAILSKYNLDESLLKNAKSFDLAWENQQDKQSFITNTLNLVNLIRLYCITDLTNLNDIIEKYDIILTSDEISLAIDLLLMGQEINNIIDYTDMLYYPVYYNMEAYQFDYVYIDEVQDVSTIQRLLMLKSVKETGRFICVGDKYQCQPPETLVRLSNGNEVRIDELKIGDNVISYNANKGKGFVGYYTSEAFVKRYANISAKILDIAKHEYSGDLIKITTKTDNYTSKYTPNHRCLVKYKYVDKNKYILYLMEKDGNFRIGIMPTQSRHGFGLSVRSRQEKVEKSWILKVYDDRNEAYYNEQYYSYEFGIPQLRFIDNSTGTMRQTDMDSIWVRFNKPKMFNNAIDLLNSFGRLYEHPFWYQNSNIHNSRTGICEIRACNLIPEIMMVPCFNSENRGANGYIKAEFQEFDLVREHYDGLVYSLKVSKEECYVGDNILTHNSIYGFAGADDESFDKLLELPNITVLPLSESYRCGKKIIESVKHIVNDIEAHHTNPEGIINKFASVNKIESGDMVLCRNTFPLVKLCLKLASEGKKANVMGTDIGKGIINLLEKTNESDSHIAIGKLYKTLETTLERIIKKTGLKPEAAKRKSEYGSLLEKINLIEVIYRGLPEDANSVNDITRKINAIFKDSGDGIILATVHKSKGLEAGKVHIIHPELMPSPYAEKDWQLKQEDNLIYVARTRAINELNYVVDYDAYDECGDDKLDFSNIDIKESKHIGSIGERIRITGEIIEIKHVPNYNTDVYVVEDNDGNILEHWGTIPHHFTESKNKKITVGTKIKGTIKVTKHTSFNNVNKTNFKCLR
jgi:superfamily I DNA/RNA helicase